MILCKIKNGMTKHKTRCLLPFHHIAIRPNNDVYPCCQFVLEKNIPDFNLRSKDVFNHPFMQELRTKMINDEPVEGCSMCYKQEESSNGTKSMRLDFLKELGEDIPKIPVLTHIDLALSNLCNNKCRMCNADLSTSWYNDSKLLGLSIPKGIKYSNDILAEYDLSKLRFIKLIGGEPLLEQQKFIDILKRCDLPNLSILIATNATVIPNDELHQLLKKCKHVSVNLSIDAFGELNNFLRKGSDWDNVISTVDWFHKNFRNRCQVHGVISIYNVNNFYMLSDFITTRYKGLINTEWVVLDNPSWMRPCHLPTVEKELLLKKLKGKISKSLYFLLEDEFKNLSNISLFLEADNKLNAVRREQWKQINTELYQMIGNINE